MTGNHIVNTGQQELFECMQSALERQLAECIGDADKGPDKLIEAQRYMLLLPAKRVRPLLTLLVADAWGLDWKKALPAACAIEMVHAASLIVDDLPCMDDAKLRRGAQPAHVQFGEPTAILAAFGLMNKAFEIVSRDTQLSEWQRLALIDILTTAIGPSGLTGGQQEDLHCTVKDVTDIERIHRAKTAALFSASVDAGSVSANIRESRRYLLADAGTFLGLAFQASDDLLDAHAAPEASGKLSARTVGPGNLASVVGFEETQARAEKYLGLATECLEASGAKTEIVAGFISQITEKLQSQLKKPR